jgi:dolichol-phosphate mannosyltransferase
VPKTLVIVCTYNERENIESLVADILVAAAETDILVVDDNSPDGTGKVADHLAQGNPRVHVLHRPGKLGLGTAYLDGFRYALDHGYDAAITMDADFSHDPKYLPDLIAGADRYDLTVGSRYIPGGGTQGWGLHRRVLSAGANALTRFLLGVRSHDCTGGYRCYRRRLLERLLQETIDARGYSCLLELIYRTQRLGFTIGETPIIFADRRAGKTKISRKELIGGIKTLLRLRFTRIGR